MPFGSSDRLHENSVMENVEENLRQENEKLKCQLKEMQMVIAEKEARLEKDFNQEVKKERLCQISLKVFDMIRGDYKSLGLEIGAKRAIKDSMFYAKMFLQEDK